MEAVEVEEAVLTPEEWSATLVFRGSAPYTLTDALQAETGMAARFFDTLTKMASPSSKVEPPKKEAAPPRDLKEIVEPARWPVCTVDEVSYKDGATRLKVRVPIATFIAASRSNAARALGERASNDALVALLDHVTRRLRDAENEKRLAEQRL